MKTQQKLCRLLIGEAIKKTWVDPTSTKEQICVLIIKMIIQEMSYTKIHGDGYI